MIHTRNTTADLPTLVAATLFALTAAGCDLESDAIGQRSDASTCPIWACGTNSAEVNDIPIGELHQFPGENHGLANSWGARLAGFRGPGGEDGYTLDMRRGTLRAVKGAITLSGAGLIGSIITIDTGTGDMVDVTVAEFQRVPSWTTSGFWVDQFVFTAVDPQDGIHRSICTDATDTSSASAWAVITSAERYSWADKAVLASGAAGLGWNTIACHGNSLYKMKMTGYEADAQINNPHVSDVEARQTTLKMFTADYCGTGESFTEDGTDLRWYNAAGWADSNDGAITAFEAYWNADGALCLDTPRLGAAQMAAITAECATVGKVLGPCSSFAGPYVWASEVPL